MCNLYSITTNQAAISALFRVVNLPILGIWMLPLGLLLIAQDVPLLEEPLLKTFAWVEVKWNWLKQKWREG
jgi:hypothetical protein